MTAQATAKKLPDGRVVVEDVPMIGEEFETDPRFRRERAWRSKLEGKPARPRDRRWLQRCFSILSERVKSGFKLPLTFRHSDDKPALAGEWMPVKIGTAQMNPGEPERATIFVNRVYKDEATFRLAQKEFPYTSPELSPDYPDEIDALSHLSEAPYNKFALPEVRELFRVDPFYRSKRAIPAQLLLHGKIVETQASAKNPYAVANAMANKGEITRKRVGEVGDAIKENQSVAATGSALGARGLNEKQEASHMGDMDTAIAEGEKATDGGVAGDVKPAATGPDEILKGLGAKIDALVDLHTKSHGEMMACMKSFMEGMGKPEVSKQADKGTTEAKLEDGMTGEKGGETENMATTDDDEEGAPKSDPAVYRTIKVLRGEIEKQRTAREADAKAFAEVKGEVLGLRKAQQILAAEKEQTSLESGARNRLVAIGFELTPEDDAEIKKAAKLGKPFVDSLVAGYQRGADLAGPSLPTYGHAEAEERTQTDELPEEIKALVAKGGEVASAAKSLYRTWQGMNAKDRAFYGDSIENMLYDRDAQGNPILPRAQKTRG